MISKDLPVDSKIKFGKALILAVLTVMVVGNFLGIHQERIHQAQPDGPPQEAPSGLITSAHVHANLLSLVTLVFTSIYLFSLGDISWPDWITESALLSMTFGAFLFPLQLIFTGIAISHNPAFHAYASMISPWSIFFFAYGTVAYAISYGIGAVFGGDL